MVGRVDKDRVRAKRKDGDTVVRVLLAHPMHTGRNKDEAGNVVAIEYIQDIRCWRNEIEVLSVKCGTGVSQNPYFSFGLVGGAAGDVIQLRWVDNLGAKGTVETIVQ